MMKTKDKPPSEGRAKAMAKQLASKDEEERHVVQEPERRMKLWHVSPERIMTLLSWAAHDQIHVFERVGLPRDVRVLDIFDDHYTRTIVFLLQSDEWDEVPHGEMTPSLEGPMHILKTAELRQGTDGKWGVAEENPLTPDDKCLDCNHRATDRCPFCVDDNCTRVACVKHEPIPQPEPTP